jgi:transposase-like protein
MQSNIDLLDCGKCGCNATEMIAAGMRFGKPWVRYRCDHCGHEFTLGNNPAREGIVNGVVFHVVRCPGCKSKNTEVTRKANERIRYHKCRDCGQSFKSVESP